MQVIIHSLKDKKEAIRAELNTFESCRLKLYIVDCIQTQPLFMLRTIPVWESR